MNVIQALKIKAENDKLFADGTGAEMTCRFIEDFQPVPLQRPSAFALSENIRAVTTIECILQNRGKRVIALNFANALFPGGAYTLGGNAQEESLCRASLLYYSIREESGFYRANREKRSALYTDGMLLSENVPVIRTDDGRLLDEPMTADFVTCPAVNRRELLPWQTSRADEVMERRIEKIVSFMQSLGHEVIVLGAFGCGAFRNKREKVLPCFERAINRYTDGSAEIIFAMP